METNERFERLPLKSIQEPSHQLREHIDHEALGELADSMASEGLHQPIGVRGPLLDGGYEIVFGHRRFLAARLLRWETIAARVFADDFDPLLAAVSENLQRSDLNPLEEARVCLQFQRRGEPTAGIARLLRRSIPWVQDRLSLLDLPQDLQDAVAARTLSLGVVRLLADVDHEAYRTSLIREASTTGATARVVEVWRAHYLADRDRYRANADTVETIVEERQHYIVSYECEWCSLMFPFEQTGSIRLCAGCLAQLREAKARAVAAGAG